MHFIMKIVLTVVVCLGMIFVSIPNACADQASDIILQLLIKKGVISQEDVDQVHVELNKIKVIKGPEVAAKIPEHVKKASWAERIKFKGDIRLRNEYQQLGAGEYVNRMRLRARLGAEAQITETLKAGIFMASGGRGFDDDELVFRGNARSTNQTYTDVFGTKSFDLDMAYIDWQPFEFIQFTGGKYKNPLYRPGDLLWDGDLRFEGVSTNIKYSLEDEFNIPVDVMMNAGYFDLDDLSNDSKNPKLWAIQGGLGSSIGDIADWKTFFSYYDFAKIQNSFSIDLPPTTGTPNADGNYNYDFDIIEINGDVTFHLLEQNLPKPFNQPLTLFGDLVKNVSGGSKDYAWQLGTKLGKKPKKFGDWRSVYNIRGLERDSFPAQFPDADSFRGRTEGYGHEFIFSFGLAKNVWLEFDWYAFRDKTRGVDPNDKWGYIFQSDLNVKF